MDNLFLKSISILLLFFSCNHSGEDNSSAISGIYQINYRISNGWEVSGLNLQKGYYVINNQGTNSVFTGSILHVEFADTFRIATLKLQIPSENELPESAEFKLYINHQFVGRFKGNKNIKIEKDVFAIRLIFSKTGNEKIIRAWDEDFYYSMLKDTSRFGLKGVSVKFKIDTSKTGTIEFQSLKNEDVLALDNPNMVNNNLHFSKPVFILKRQRNQNNFTEQIVCIDKNGDFQIYQVTTDNSTEKPRSDIFYHGKYFVSSDSDSIYFKGKISGLPSKPGKKEFTCNLKSGFNASGLNLNGFPANIMFDFPDHSVLNIKTVDPSINVDIPYASTKNITKQKLYSCNKCFLRYLVLKKILKIRNEIRKNGLDIKLLDCYRPFDVQKLLYEVFPVKGYVADPVGGSIHNRGTAIDITLTDLAGNDLDMGSGYDEFSPKSHFSYSNLPDSILNYRLLLHKTMLNNNFVPIRMEWWHFEDVYARKYKNMNDPFPCGDDW